MGESAGWPVDREEVQTLCPSPGDDGMSTPVHGGPSMDLKWQADEDGGAAAPTLIATGQSRVPETMPTRLPSHELKASEPGAKMAVLLYQ